MKLSTRNKIGAGATLSIFGGSGIVLVAIVRGFQLVNPVGISLLFAAGISAGLGAVLTVCGLYEKSHASHTG